MSGTLDPDLRRVLAFSAAAGVGLAGGTVVALLWHSLWGLLSAASVVALVMAAGLIWAASIPQSPPGRHRARRWT